MYTPHNVQYRIRSWVVTPEQLVFLLGVLLFPQVLRLVCVYLLDAVAGAALNARLRMLLSLLL